VTLGNGLTKDRFVQACMRMRKLGNGHALTFWSSHEVHQQIARLKQWRTQKISEGVAVCREGGDHDQKTVFKAYLRR
jgi:hypothetical protein